MVICQQNCNFSIIIIIKAAYCCRNYIIDLDLLDSTLCLHYNLIVCCYNKYNELLMSSRLTIIKGMDLNYEQITL